MLTLSEVNELLGGGMDNQTVMARIRKMEQVSGRTILVARGEGRQRRYLVRPDELSAARAEDAREPSPQDLDALAAQIAEQVQAMDERHTQMSLSVVDMRKRIEKLEDAFRGILKVLERTRLG
jgi:hypothetical protein